MKVAILSQVQYVYICLIGIFRVKDANKLAQNPTKDGNNLSARGYKIMGVVEYVLTMINL